MCLSKFEQLPDEMLLEICQYLSTFDIINVFENMNSRLQRTISQFRRDIDLREFTPGQFRHWCLYLLPFTANCLVKLLLDNTHTPGQIRLFIDYINNYSSIHQLLPNLKHLCLFEFSNDDVGILPKISTLEKLWIVITSRAQILRSTEFLLDRYLFCEPNTLKDLKFNHFSGGIQLLYDAEVQTSSYLEQLAIDVATLDDLVLIFKRAPNLITLSISINRVSTKTPK